jgi:molybdopterin molybdotransferase
MTALSYVAAREMVLRKADAAGPLTGTPEVLPLLECAHRVLHSDALADRDYPPVARSIRDGFALKSSDLPGELEVVGEVRAGQVSTQVVGPRQTIEIMTGAPLPEGADTVVMVEHVSRHGTHIGTDKQQPPGQFVIAAGVEARAGKVVVPAGEVLSFTHIGMLATVGLSHVAVNPKPRVAILSTGDEVIDIQNKPQPFEVRNSNACSLAVQVARAGGAPWILPVARDVYDHTKALIEEGLEGSDLLLLSGGVSAGKYDIVEEVLADLGAVFHFTRVLIQPGQPVVFGEVGGKLFFGLPGNPASTMVCFEIFARLALQVLAGVREPRSPLAYATLTAPFRHKTGLTRFLPARMEADGLRVTPVPWQGSSDVPALVRANCWLVAEAERESWAVGDLISVWML